MRVGDADRERVAERLRVALEEGRLSFYEYDDRVGEAYAAKTYSELDRLLADLPAPAPTQVAVPAKGAVAGPDAKGRYPGATRHWLAERWGGWLSAVAIVTGIWAVTSLLNRGPYYFWPGWVAGPWGVVLLVHTISGLANREPQRLAAKRARKAALREREAKEIEQG
jgi:uncharacterized protein DUF1707